MNTVFRADVTRLVDFDFDEPTPGYEGCIEVVLQRIRGFMNLGETATLIVSENGPRFMLRLKGTVLGQHRPMSLRTGELPLLLEKATELQCIHLIFEPGMRLESEKQVSSDRTDSE